MNRHFLASTVVTAVVAGSLSGQPLSFKERTLTAGLGPTSIVAADFNNDGKLDFAVGSSEGVSVLLGNGDGTFQRPLSVALPQGTIPNFANRRIAVADFNGDGKLDLAEGISAVLLLGRGDGTFQAPISYGVPGPLAAGDLNGDGKPDMAVRRSAGTVSILLGNGDGTFQQPAEFSAATSSYELPGGEVTIADFNGDGRPDLAVAGSTNGGFAVLIGKGDGTFSQSFAVAGCAPNLACYGAAGYPLGVGDFNGDGKLDIITSYGFGQQRGAVMLGNGDGTFRELPGQTFSDGKLFPHGVGQFPSAIVVADLNGDGKLDAVFGYGDQGAQDGVHNDYQMVSVCLGNGDGSFQLALAIGVGERPSSVALGDFNGDGKPDLAVSNETSNNVTALINQGPGTYLTAVSAAGLTGPVAPEALASLFGPLPASGRESADPQALPTTLAGITIKVRDSLGTERRAPLLYASPAQANFQIPAGTAPGDAAITVMGGGTSLGGFAQVENTGPAIFTLDFDAPVAFAVRIEPDGTQTPVQLDCRPGSCDHPAPGITLDDRPVYLSLIGTGIRNRTALSNVACTIGGANVPVEYAGPAPGFVGVDQVNLRLTKGLPLSDNDPLILSVDGRPANKVYIAIK
jgi:uncharacterized protein (TIGR03437 family)